MAYDILLLSICRFIWDARLIYITFVDCREKGVHKMKCETYYKIMTLLGVANLVLYCIEIFK